jgi:hypothetical protein
MYSNINEYLESRPGHSTMEDKSFIYSRELDTFLSCSWYQTYTKLFNIRPIESDDEMMFDVRNENKQVIIDENMNDANQSIFIGIN